MLESFNVLDIILGDIDYDNDIYLIYIRRCFLEKFHQSENIVGEKLR